MTCTKNYIAILIILIVVLAGVGILSNQEDFGVYRPWYYGRRYGPRYGRRYRRRYWPWYWNYWKIPYDYSQVQPITDNIL